MATMQNEVDDHPGRPHLLGEVRLHEVGVAGGQRGRGGGAQAASGQPSGGDGPARARRLVAERDRVQPGVEPHLQPQRDLRRLGDGGHVGGDGDAAGHDGQGQQHPAARAGHDVEHREEEDGEDQGRAQVLDHHERAEERDEDQHGRDQDLASREVHPQEAVALEAQLGRALAEVECEVQTNTSFRISRGWMGPRLIRVSGAASVPLPNRRRAMNVAEHQEGQEELDGGGDLDGVAGQDDDHRGQRGRDEDALRELRTRPELVGEGVAVAHLQREADAGGHHRRRQHEGREDVAPPALEADEAREGHGAHCRPRT